MSAHTHQVPTPLILRKVSPDVMSSSARVSRTKPTPSSVRPCTGSDSGTPNRIAKKTSVTAAAGTISVVVTFWPSASNSSPAPIAPTIAPNSSATTSRPAARRVRDAAVPVRRPRSKISAISSGSHTT